MQVSDRRRIDGKESRRHCGCQRSVRNLPDQDRKFVCRPVIHPLCIENAKSCQFCPAKTTLTGQSLRFQHFVQPSQTVLSPDKLRSHNREPQPQDDSGKTDSSLSQTVSRIMALTIFLVTPSPTVGKDISSWYLFGQGDILTVSSSLN